MPDSAGGEATAYSLQSDDSDPASLGQWSQWEAIFQKKR